MKSVVIDRVMHTRSNNWTGGRETSYYVYTIHLVGVDESPTTENMVYRFDGRDYRDEQTQRQVNEMAEKLASIGEGIEIKRLWEAGEISYLVLVMVPVRAASPEAAETMVKQALASNVIGSRARYHTREGA